MGIRDLTLTGQGQTVAAKAQAKAKLLATLAEASYSKMGGRNHTSADSSFADRSHIDVHVAAMQQAIGSKWQYVTRADADGGETHPYFDPEVGEIVYPDDKGRVKTMNKQYLDTMLSIENAIEDKVDQIMQYAIASEQMCMDILDLTYDEYVRLLAPQKAGNSEQTKLKMSVEMTALDGTITSIKSTPAGSITQTEKISKLRYVCRALRKRVAIRDIHRHIEDVNKAGEGIDVEVGKAAVLASNTRLPKVPGAAAAAP
jgi:hypothetical protein